jgi:SOS-response transcriptional repressor LexA
MTANDRRRLVWHAVSTVHPTPSHRDLMALTGSPSRDTINRDLHHLQDLGYIAIVPRRSRAIRVLVPLIDGDYSPATQEVTCVLDA